MPFPHPYAMFLCDVGAVVDPIANHADGVPFNRFRFPVGSHVLEQLGPRRLTGPAEIPCFSRKGLFACVDCRCLRPDGRI